MPRYLLDTNVLSEFARSQAADLRVDRWLKGIPDEYLFTSVLTLAEIRRGIELLPAGHRRSQLEVWQFETENSFQSRLLPVTKTIGDRWALLAAQAQRRGTPVAIVDGFIAATASVHELTVATRNVKDFAHLGIAVFNPWDA